MDGPRLSGHETRLIRRIAAGDPDALDEAFGLYADRIFRIAYGITRSVSESEDIVQDIFLALPAKAASFEGRAEFTTWLHRVTVRVTLMRRRRERRHRQLMESFRGFLRPAPTDEALNRIAAERALDGLPTGSRRVVWLRVVEEWSHAEIGEALGITADASSKRYRRALRAMASLVEEGEEGDDG